MPASSSSAAESKTQSSKGAFTLVELLAVIAIVGILAAVVLGGGRRANEAGKSARAKAEIAALSAAAESFRRRHGDYPRTGDAAEWLQSLLGRRALDGTTADEGALIDLAQFATEEGGDPLTNPTVRLVDPWGRPYWYCYKTGSAEAWKANGFVLYSVGPNGVHVPPAGATGVFDALHVDNADNIYAGL